MKAGTIFLLKTVVFIAMVGVILFISQWVFPIVGGWFTFFAIVLLLVLAIFLMAGLGGLLGDKKPKSEERPEEQGKEEKRPMKRGWILFWSFVLEASVIAALLLPAPFIFPWSTTAGLVFAVVDGLVAALVVLGLGFLLVYFWWAPNNLFFTFVPEGRVKIVVRGAMPWTRPCSSGLAIR